MTDITATLSPTDQSAVSTIVGNVYSSIDDVETKVSYMSSAVLDASFYMTDQGAIDALNTAYSNLFGSVHLLHLRLNTLACKSEDAFALSRGTWHGSGGTFHSDSGGTDKGS